MSHTFTSADGVVFHYDGAFDGLVKLRDTDHAEVEVSISSLLQFAAEAIRDQRQSELDDASTADLLGIKLPLPHGRRTFDPNG